MFWVRQERSVRMSEINKRSWRDLKYRSKHAAKGELPRVKRPTSFWYENMSPFAAFWMRMDRVLAVHVASLERWSNEDYRRRTSEQFAQVSRTPEKRAKSSQFLKKLWEIPGWGENHIREINKNRNTASSIENRVFALIHFHHLPYDFVGDGKLLIGESKGKGTAGYRCPDFVHRNQKFLVEVASESEKKFRGGYKSKEDYEQVRRTYFSFYGWQVLFLWSDMTDEEIVQILRTLRNKEIKVELETHVL